MDPVSFLPVIGAMLSALLMGYLIAKRFGVEPAKGRFSSIDGLRGYLAFFVFLHHSCIWFFYLKTDQWRVPPSNLYTHFGQSSVALFFMITGFLFFSKILDGRKKKIDWLKLFVSRFLRLTPLYAFSMALLFFIVFALSQWTLKEPLYTVTKELICWSGFTILGDPNINGVSHTSIIIAGVTWSIPYEWFFYLSLPVLALAVLVIPPLPFIALGIAGVLSFAWWQPSFYHLLAFLGGIVSAFLVRSDLYRKLCTSNFSALIAIAFISMTITLFPTTYGLKPIILLSGAFAIIAGGNTLFGALTNDVSRTLGEMAYSIYLLHGILLFVTFTFVLGTDKAKLFSAQEHWLTIIALAPVLIATAYATFRLIEQPGMQSTNAATAWLRSRRIFGYRASVTCPASTETQGS